MTLLQPGRAASPHVVTLVAVAAVNAMAMNVFLPSLPNMARYFDTDYSVIQLLVSLYLVATAFIQLFVGPLSDRFGRRPVLLVALSIFAASTFAAAYAPTVELLIAARLLQSSSAAGMVLSRAVVRDTVTNLDDAATKISYVTMGMSIMPMIGPVIGGYLDELYGWKSTFLLTFAFGAVTLLLVIFDLGETHHNRTTSLAAQLKAYPELIRSRRYWGYASAASFSSGAFYAFVGGGPFMATEMLHMQPSQYGLYFAFISFGYLLGNFASGRYSRRIGVDRMMLNGSLFAMAGVLTTIGLFAFGIFTPLSIFAPLILVGVGNGMTLPNANAGMVSVRPHLAGSAAGLGGMLLVGIGALLAFLAGSLLTVETGPLPLLLLMLLSAGLTFACCCYVLWVARIFGTDDGFSDVER